MKHIPLSAPTFPYANLGAVPMEEYATHMGPRFAGMRA